MGMYVAYYWTTLVAMLILYKGIHQAAKNLEKKAKAKEHRHIALLLTQRLGTQVGVSLMLQSRRQDSLPTEGNKDSGYQTNNLSTTVVNNYSDPAEIATLEVIKERSSSTRKKSSDHIIRRHKLLEHNNSSKSIQVPKHPALRPVKSATLSVNQSDSITPDDDRKFQDLGFYDITTADSFSTLFNDDSFSSVLQFKAMSIADSPDIDRSDTTSVICRTRSQRSFVRTFYFLNSNYPLEAN